MQCIAFCTLPSQTNPGSVSAYEVPQTHLAYCPASLGNLEACSHYYHCPLRCQGIALKSPVSLCFLRQYLMAYQAQTALEKVKEVSLCFLRQYLMAWYLSCRIPSSIYPQYPR